MTWTRRYLVFLALMSILILAPMRIDVVRAKDDYDWPMLAHDPSHTSATPSRLGAPLTQRIVYNFTPQQLVGPPIVSGDSLFAFVQGAYFHVQTYSLDLGTGTVKWSYDTGGSLSAWPAASDKFIFVPVSYMGPPPQPNGTKQDIYTTGPGALIALDSTNGRLVWSRRTVRTIMASPIVEAGIVYATFDGDGVYAFDAASGNVKWFYPWPSSSLLLASPIEYDGTVVVPVYAQGVIAFDAQSGGMKWKYDVASHFAFHPGAVGEVTAGAGMVFVPFYDFSDDQRSRYRVTLVAFNPNDGQVIWQTLLQDFAFESGFAGRTYLAFANKTMCATGGYHDLNGTSPGTGPIIALDAQTGALKWRTSVARPYSRIIATSDMLLVLSDISPTVPPGSRCDNCTLNDVVALNSSNGGREWIYPIDTWFDPVLAEGALYITQVFSISSLLGNASGVPEFGFPVGQIVLASTLLLALVTISQWRGRTHSKFN